MNGPVARRFQLIVVPLLLVGGTTVCAQEQPDAETTDDNERIIEEVIVTARKRAESVRDIPTSIDAFTGVQLEARGATTLEQILKFSPGVTLESGFTPSSSTIHFRGITNQTRGVGPHTVGRFYGGVPLNNPSIIGHQPDLDPFDMQTVEVLKGPQGTLFGGSALAGAVRYVPIKPDFEEFHGSTSIAFGTTASSDDNNQEYSLMLNLPLADSFAVRFAGSYRNYPGYIDDVRNGEDDINDYVVEQGRIIAAWRPTERVTVELSYIRQEGDLGAYAFLEGTDTDRIREHKFLPEWEFTEMEIFGARIDWDFEAFSIVFDNNWMDKARNSADDVTWFLGWQNIGFKAYQQFTPQTDQNTHELRIVSNEPTGGSGLFGNWDYTVGLFYMDAYQDRPGYIFIDFGAAQAEIIGGEFAVAKEEALFFDLTRYFGDQWELNLGGRLFKQDTATGAFLASGGVLGIPNSDPSTFGTVKEDGFNPKAALTWHATNNISVIASVADGFRFGGTNSGVGQAAAFGFDIPATFGSDQLTNWELGIRSSWRDQTLTADITAFFIDWEDLQIQQRADIFAFVQNAGKAEVKGVEIAVNAILPAGFSVLVNGAYVDAQTSSDFDSAESGLVESGTRLPQAPKLTGAASLQYENRDFAWNFNGSLTYSFRDDSHNDLRNTIPLDGYDILDMVLSVSNPALRLQPTISLIAKNLTDENVATFGFDLAPSQSVTLITPRQLLLKLDLHF